MASTDITPVQSGQVHFELQLHLPNQGAVNALSPQVSFQGATITESVHAPASASIRLRSITTTYFERLLKAVAANGSPTLRFRYGVGIPGQIQWLPWQLHLVMKNDAIAVGAGPEAGHEITLVTSDALSIVNRVARVAAHRGTISRIVRAIAERNHISDTVIEDTVGEGVWYQSFQGDEEFVRSRLVARARSKLGRGNYFLYMRDNALHFHTLDYHAQIKAFNYYAGPRSANLALTDLSQMKMDVGASGVRVATHDPYTGLAKEFKSDPDKALRLGNTIPRLDKVSGGERQMQLHLSSNRAEEFLNIAQNAYEHARGECFQLRLSVKKMTPARAGDILQVTIDPVVGRTSTWSGAYMVVTAIHTITNGDIESVYALQRGEQVAAKGVSNSLAGLGVKTVQDEQNARGFDPNLPETQASSLTRGAGKSGVSSTFLTVQDRQKAILPETKPSDPIIPQT